MLLRQPQHGPFQIDWSNPITKGLVSAPNFGTMYDAATLLPCSTSGSVSEIVTPAGVGQYCTGGAYVKATVPLATGSIPPGVSVFVLHVPVSFVSYGALFRRSAAAMNLSVSTDGSGYINYRGINSDTGGFPTGTPALVANSVNSFAYVASAANADLYYVNGIPSTAAGYAASGTQSDSEIWFGVGGGGYSSSDNIYIAAFVFNRDLRADEVVSLHRNPWQIYADYSDVEVLKSSGGGGLSLTGSLTGQGSTLSASATNTEVHAISGTLVGAGATLSGTATRIYSLTGALTGQGATLSGSATTLESHSATGALVGSGSTLSATATNTEIHTATGSLIGAGSTLSGSSTNTPLGINASGSLVGQGAALSATATNTEVHTCTGALYGQGATLSGALTRVFSASGSLVGAGSTLAATATNTEIHAATGALVGSGSTLSGSSTNTPVGINASGSLVGQGATLAATATNTEVHTCTGALYGQGATVAGAATVSGITVWPLASDVRRGVSYGPTGNDYTGTLSVGTGSGGGMNVTLSEPRLSVVSMDNSVYVIHETQRKIFS